MRDFNHHVITIYKKKLNQLKLVKLHKHLRIFRTGIKNDTLL